VGDILHEPEYADVFQDVDLGISAREGELVLISNSTVIGFPTCVEDTELHHEITATTIDRHLANFRSQYNDVIAVLRDRVLSLEIRFGAVYYD
jgi:hypothetical protein